MLVHLSIQNFAIIAQAEITPGAGLTIVSGETGAGKSVIINAINLILGGRANNDLIRSGAEAATVEALFSVADNPEVKRLLDEMGLPREHELLIRRSIFREGRNKIFINGSLATLNMLARLGPVLVSISGQHEHQQLLRPDQHLYLLDEFAGLTAERRQFNRHLLQYQDLCRQAGELEAALQALEERQELARFQIQEIEQAGLRTGEEEDLLQERRRLQNAGELLEITATSYYEVYEQPDSLLAGLSNCRKRLERGARLDPVLSPLTEVLAEVEARLEDVAFSLRDFQKDLASEPHRQEEVMQRLETIKHLKRKYGPTVEQVLQLAERLAQASCDLDHQRRDAQSRRAEADRLYSELQDAATTLSARRQAAARAMKSQMEQELQLLNMGRAQFEVSFQTASPDDGASSRRTGGGLRPDGEDQLEFLLAPNAGEGLKPLSRIASGGELSRIMLALKTLLAKGASVETVIFDEVDAGISGATAEVVGEKIKALSDFHQIICITHLPQIASQGDMHLLVRKEVHEKRTQAAIIRLDEAARITEIARLMAGRKITPSALAHAEQMLK